MKRVLKWFCLLAPLFYIGIYLFFRFQASLEHDKTFGAMLLFNQDSAREVGFILPRDAEQVALFESFEQYYAPLSSDMNITSWGGVYLISEGSSSVLYLAFFPLVCLELYVTG